MAEVVNTYRFKTRPYKHQVRALKKMLRNGRGALFMEMGTGKTKVAIDWACATAVRENPRAPAIHALVLCPASVIGVWEKELAKHDPFHENDFMGVHWWIETYEWAWRPHNYDELVDWMEERPTVLICDESHKVKTHSARRSIAAYRLARHCIGALILTGTPITKNPLDLFGQFKVVDPTVFGTRWTAFRRRYAEMGGFMGHEIKRFRRKKEMARKIAPLTFRITKEECLDLPTRSHTVVPVSLQPKTQELYTQLATEAVASFGGVETEAPIVLTKLLRLQQLTGGYLHGAEGRARVGTEKKQVLGEQLELMAEQGRRKVGVCCRFIPELHDIAQVAHDVGYKVLLMHGGVSRDKRDRIFSAFEESKQRVVFASQIQTGALGRNELVVAHEAISYSLTFALDDFQQWIDRYHRPGQQHHVTYYHLVVPGSVDEAVLLALRTKRDLAKLVLKHPQLITQPKGAKK